MGIKLQNRNSPVCPHLPILQKTMHVLVLSIAQYYHGFYNSYNIDVHIGIVVIPLRVVCLVFTISIQMRDHFDTSKYMNETPTVYHMVMSRTFKCLQKTYQICLHQKSERQLSIQISQPGECKGPRVFTREPTHQVSARAHGCSPVGLSTC